MVQTLGAGQSAISQSKQGRCPACRQSSETTHGYYQRAPKDVPCDGKAVTLRLWVRRFCCRNPACSKATFTEQLAGWLPAYGRRTSRLTQLIRQVGLEVGGETGHRLLKCFCVQVSGDTVLRLLRNKRSQKEPTPRVIGVDDWAFRKGRNYGTIIVDLEAHRVIELLPDRRADTLQEWLEAHPGIEFVARDRSSEYASAIQAGCPHAEQVADRWHLLSNAREVAEKYLKSVYSRLDPFEVPAGKTYLFVTRRPAFRRAKSDRLRGAASRQRHHDLYSQVYQLRQEGLSTLLVNFAKGLEQDYRAVEAAMTHSWSNGQTEGQVNRLKLIKRQMYGRSHFDLLRLRVLQSAHST